MELVRAQPRVMVSAPVPPDDAGDIGDGGRVGEVAEGECVAAGASEVDGGGDRGCAKGDDIDASAAGDGLDVLHGACVCDAGEGELVAAGAEIDGHASWSVRRRA